MKSQPRLSPICEIYGSKSVKSVDKNQQKITIMKKLYYFFLLLPLWGFGGFAHASVSVQVLGTDFTNKTVTLRVEYANAVNDRAWVWIYLCSMQGMFQPAVISAASATSGSVLYLSTNTRGFFVTSSPATITATLDNATGQFSCCAYGSDTPPSATLNSGTYTFKGTPPFILTAADGTTTQTVTGNTLPASALTITPVILTDETGYPDFFSFCNYAGNDLFIDATHSCRQRTSGAKNWEAWILDSRDNELYRIVFLPDNKWWTAEEMRYDASATQQSYKCPNEDKRTIYNYPSVACLTGWLLPSANDLRGLTDIMSVAELLAVGTHQYWGAGVDKYGLAVIPSMSRFDQGWSTYPSGSCRVDGMNIYFNAWTADDGIRASAEGATGMWKFDKYWWQQVRCIRQL
jgi:uncharacterized protein (TIGR02145 family)